ncbi:MAG: 3-hydroxyacyl-CoA dehydrogenase NAD-binding domain-containing protein [Chloroflexota bacterium]
MTFRIDKVGIVGAGTMGGGIAAHLANVGIPGPARYRPQRSVGRRAPEPGGA